MAWEKTRMTGLDMVGSAGGQGGLWRRWLGSVGRVVVASIHSARLRLLILLSLLGR